MEHTRQALAGLQRFGDELRESAPITTMSVDQLRALVGGDDDIFVQRLPHGEVRVESLFHPDNFLRCL